MPPPKENAELPEMVELEMESVPRLKMPPPLVFEVLPEMVELEMESVPQL